ncbi:MAG: hypothetical protein ABEJ43_10990 [Haloferacaceae archaeon]
MRRTPVLAVALLFVVSSALGGPTSGGTPTAPASPTDTTDAPPETTAVEYAVSAGDLPDETATARVTLRVVFVETTADLGPCYPGAFTGPYRPTITPIPPPDGECHRSEAVTVSLANLTGERSLTFEGAASAEGHALLLTNATVRYANGTRVANLRGASTTELAAVAESPGEGPYAVEIRIDAYDDRRYDYWLFGRRPGSG